MIEFIAGLFVLMLIFGFCAWHGEIQQRRMKEEVMDSQDNALAQLGRRLAVNDKAIARLLKENRELRRDAIELARDVDWFVRMSSDGDAGMRQCVDKAKLIIKTWGGGDD